MGLPLHVRIVRTVARAGAGVAAAFGWLVRPIEGAIAWLLGRTMAASEGAERLEDALAWLARQLLAPIRGLAWIARQIVPESVREWLGRVGETVSGAVWAVFGGVMRVAEWLNLDAVFHWLAWLTWPVWRPFAGVLGFIYAWIATRDWRQFVWGVPALVLLLVPVVFSIHTYTRGSRRPTVQYREALELASAAHDHDRVRLYERKLVQLGVDTRVQTFNRGLALAESGKLPAAYQVMQQLAPEDEPGYPMARFWIIERLLEGKLESDESQRDQALDAQLTALEDDKIEHPIVDIARASLLIKQDELAAAAERLRPHADSLVFAALEILRLDMQLRNAAELEVDARRVIGLLMKQQSRRPLTGDEYAYLTVALEVTNRVDDLATVYNEWLAADPENPAVQVGWARVAQRRVERMVANPTTSPDALADLIVRAATFAPNQAWTDRQIERLYQLRNSSVIQSTLPEKTVVALLDNPQVPLSVVNAIGVQAALASQWQRATGCFEQVVALQPENFVALNNLAWVLLTSDEANRIKAQAEGRPAQVNVEQLQRALDAVNRAVKLRPDEYRFRETRGQILVALEQWPAAIDDLQFALNGLPDNPNIHTAMATAYRATGEEDLAAVHERAAGAP